MKAMSEPAADVNKITQKLFHGMSEKWYCY